MVTEPQQERVGSAKWGQSFQLWARERKGIWSRLSYARLQREMPSVDFFLAAVFSSNCCFIEGRQEAWRNVGRET